MKCPYCEQEEFVTGKQGVAYAGITVSFLKEKAVYHEICVNCGTIARSYVKNPGNLRESKKRHALNRENASV